jgi:hypothetical protein
MPDTAYLNEEWKVIPSFPVYEASSLGRIRRIPGTYTHGSHSVKSCLKLILDQDGYKFFTASIGGVGYPLRVHRAVAEAFIGPKPEGKEVNHIDSNKINNRPTNLEYLTPRENLDHKYRMGRCARGEKNGAARWTEDDVRRARELARSGMPHNKISDLLGMPSTTLHQAIHGLKWAYIEGAIPIVKRTLVAVVRTKPKRKSPVSVPLGSARYSSKLTEAQVLEIRRLATVGVYRHIIGKKFGVSQSNVSNIVNRKVWRHI